MSSVGSDLFPRQPRLPPELIHCIIESCDKKSLPNCNLVSWTWHSITAPLLCSQFSIRLDDEDNILSDFFSFLQGGTHLARHVKSFTIENGRLDVYQLIQLFSYFPRLRDLTVDGTVLTAALVVDSIPLPVHNPPARPTLPIPHLESLTICRVGVVRYRGYCQWSPIFDLISSFSAIDRLVLDYIRNLAPHCGSSPDGLTNIAPGGKAKIGELVFLPELNEEVEEFAGVMAEHLDVTQVHTLKAAQWDLDKYDLFKQVMAIFGGVKHFCFLLRESNEGYYVSFPASRSSLESVTFSIKLYNPFFEDEALKDLQGMFSSSLRALSSIAQAGETQLSTIRYEFLGEFSVGPKELDRFGYLKWVVEIMDWPSLGSILSKDAFKKLRTVEVLLTVPNVFPDVCPDGMSIAEHHVEEAKKRAVLVDVVKDQLSNFIKGYASDVWVRDA